MQAYRFTCKFFRHKHKAARNDGIQRRDGSRSKTKSLKLLQGRREVGHMFLWGKVRQFDTARCSVRAMCGILSGLFNVTDGQFLQVSFPRNALPQMHAEIVDPFFAATFEQVLQIIPQRTEERGAAQDLPSVQMRQSARDFRHALLYLKARARMRTGGT